MRFFQSTKDIVFLAYVMAIVNDLRRRTRFRRRRRRL